MMEKPTTGKIKCAIGIDPDVDESGLAIYFKHNKQLELMQFDLYRLFMKIVQLHLKYDVTVYLEAGHRVKKTWQRRTVGVIKDVGRNNEIGSQIEKFLKGQGIKHVLIEPKGYSSYDHDYFCKITGWDKSKRTNPEKRVAGMMAFGR